MNCIMRRLICCLSIGLAGPLALAGPWRAGEHNTNGWALMSPQERLAHQATVRGFTAWADCRAYQARHHALMEARARERGVTLTAGRDICAHLKAPESRP